jgi:hypothetical protein
VKPAIAVVAIAIAGPADAHCYTTWNYPWPQNCKVGGVYARRSPPVVAVTPPVKEAALKATDDPPAPTPAREIAVTPEGTEIWPSLKPWDEELAAERDLAVNRLRQELAAPR